MKAKQLLKKAIVEVMEKEMDKQKQETNKIIAEAVKEQMDKVRQEINNWKEVELQSLISTIKKRNV